MSVVTKAQLRDSEAGVDMNSQHQYRVSLLCACKNDLAEGYGPTVDAARQAALGFFRKAHGRREKPAEEIVEVSTPNGCGGFYYAEVSL